MSIYYRVPTPVQYWQLREQQLAQPRTDGDALPATIQSGLRGGDTGRDSSPMRFRLYASSVNTSNYTGWYECLVLLFRRRFSTGVFSQRELVGPFSTDPNFLSRVFASFPIGRQAYRPEQHGSIYSFLGNALVALRGPLILGAGSPGRKRFFFILLGMNLTPNVEYVYYVINPKYGNLIFKLTRYQLENAFYPLNNEVFYSRLPNRHLPANQPPQGAVTLNEVLGNR